MTRSILAGLLALAAMTAASGQPAASDTALDRLTKQVASELRCPVCQGESIQDSPSSLAQEMRDVVREQLRAGRTPEQVKAYFVGRYGEWILLRPRARGFNLLLYAGPVIALAAGAAVIVFVVRRWTRASPAQARREPAAPDERRSPSTVRTRRATVADAPAIRALIEEWVPSGKLLARSEEFVASHAHDFVVAVASDGRVIGCAHLEEYAPSLAELRSLAVDARHHREGIGSALVAAVEDLARRRQFATIFAVSNNGPFFLNRGYVERDIPELDRERSEVSKFKGVYARDL